ncbi:MAG: sulfotransferase [Candidatus Marinimicrobia bacterium]|nr:sulfotransferase [Candidatus Neomarinimicrobiota bacterium]
MWPNFLVVGASKAGTTSVYEQLRQHPDIYMSPLKEPHYFSFPGGLPDFQGVNDDRFKGRVVTNEQQYRHLFDGASGESAVGECSVSYLYYPAAAENIRAKIPHCRIIILLRDPVDRALSQYRQNVSNGREPLSLSEAFLAEKKRLAQNWRWIVAYRGAGLYADQVSRYIDAFGHDQVKVYLLEDLRSDAAKVMADMFAFLGVEPSFRPKLEVYNRSVLPNSSMANRLLRSKWAKWLGRLAPVALRHAVRDRLLAGNLADGPSNGLSQDERLRYHRYFAEDIARLEQLLGRDLSAWNGSGP